MPRKYIPTDIHLARAASTRLGVSLDFYLDQRAQGLMWCSQGKHWAHLTLMAVRPHLRSGRGTECKACNSQRASKAQKLRRQWQREAEIAAAQSLADIGATKYGDWPPAVLILKEGRMKRELVEQLIEQGGPDVVNSRDVKFIDMGKTVYIGRGSLWGNPHKPAGRDKYMPTWREDVVQKFLHTLLEMAPGDRINWLWPIFEALQQGKTLRCFCAPKLCHGMALAAWVRNHPEFALYWEDAAHKSKDRPLAQR